MKVKDTLTVTIEAQGKGGEGIARADGFTVFVPYTIVGERVKVAVDAVKGNLVNAHIIKMEEPSPLRVQPKCAVYGKCGGCSLQHLPYQSGLEIKARNVQLLFHKNCGLDVELPQVVGSDGEFYYRNKVALPFGKDAKGDAVLGFYKGGTHKVMPISECALQGEWVTKLIAVTLDYVKKCKLSVYDEATRKGQLRHLVARQLPCGAGYSYCVILVGCGKGLPKAEQYYKALCSAIDGEISLFYDENNLHNNVILTPELTCLFGKARPDAEFCGAKVQVSPLSFLQVNLPIAEKIYNDVAECVPAGQTVLDAYSGIGVMSAIIAKKAPKVIGVEVVQDAVNNAMQNAVNFGVADKVQHLCGDVKDVLPLIKSRLGDDFVCVTDPPRAGLAEDVIATLLDYSPQSIIYVSCNPATLTRDVKLLSAKYSVQSIKCYDMFPQTEHCESLCVLRKRLCGDMNGD